MTCNTKNSINTQFAFQSSWVKGDEWSHWQTIILILNSLLSIIMIWYLAPVFLHIVSNLIFLIMKQSIWKLCDPILFINNTVIPLKFNKFKNVYCIGFSFGMVFYPFVIILSSWFSDNEVYFQHREWFNSRSETF